MSLFAKKKLYKVVWRYNSFCTPHTEIVAAKDPAHAWKKVKREHAIHIDLVSLKEIQ